MNQELIERLALEAGFEPRCEDFLPSRCDDERDAEIDEAAYVGEYPTGLAVARLIERVVEECAKGVSEAFDPTSMHPITEEQAWRRAVAAIRDRFKGAQ